MLLTHTGDIKNAIPQDSGLRVSPHVKGLPIKVYTQGFGRPLVGGIRLPVYVTSSCFKVIQGVCLLGEYGCMPSLLS